MVSAIRHLARWLAWQVGDHEASLPPVPASITVFSTSDGLTRRDVPA